MYTITKLFPFEASHSLAGLPDTHPCSRMHGHSYLVELELKSETLNEVGFVRDYRELDIFKRLIDDKFDHRTLNEIVSFNPSAENLSFFFYQIAKRLAPEVVAVRVSETQKTWAEYRPGRTIDPREYSFDDSILNEYLHADDE
jgi:6-pyruvoyltetrahydropterin/6-carboxytetrahydropterin synthase